jgi:pyrroloquinoline quinone biosynthesis protein B
VRFLTVLICAFLLGACQSNDAPEQSDVESFPVADHELIVLGIAQDAGYPQLACNKSCCEELQKNQEKGAFVSCLGLIDRKKEALFLFDATPDLVQQLSLAGSGDVDLALGMLKRGGIFLSHAHIGHYTGLMYLGRESLGASRIPVYAAERMREFLQNNGPWSQLVELENIELRSVSEEELQFSEDLNIQTFQVPHRDEFSETLGFKITGGNKSALFIPDIDKWEKWDQPILDWLNEVDYAFVDATFYQNGEIPRDMSEVPHPFVEESIKLFSSLDEEKTDDIYFIHLNHSNPLLNPASKESEDVENLGFHVAREGQRFDL